jgi:hypothetical protein
MRSPAASPAAAAPHHPGAARQESGRRRAGRGRRRTRRGSESRNSPVRPAERADVETHEVELERGLPEEVPSVGFHLSVQQQLGGGLVVVRGEGELPGREPASWSAPAASSSRPRCRRRGGPDRRTAPPAPRRAGHAEERAFQRSSEGPERRAAQSAPATHRGKGQLGFTTAPRLHTSSTTAGASEKAARKSSSGGSWPRRIRGVARTASRPQTQSSGGSTSTSCEPTRPSRFQGERPRACSTRPQSGRGRTPSRAARSRSTPAR